jgi:uncharacterized protein (DUF305 family)
MTTTKKLLIAFVASSGLVAAGVALAQSGHGAAGMTGMHGNMHGMKGGMHGQGHGGQGHGGPGHSEDRRAGDQGASSLALAAINEKMHRDMAITYSGDTDVDFVRGMIPHHQGAIDTAKIVIAFGKDPEIRKLAEEIVKAQESEIAFMRTWLQKRGE